MQKLTIRGEFTNLYVYPYDPKERENIDPKAENIFYSDSHKWRIESYGIWWSGSTMQLYKSLSVPSEYARCYSKMEWCILFRIIDSMSLETVED